jgi:hypothetical protein
MKTQREARRKSRKKARNLRRLIRREEETVKMKALALYPNFFITLTQKEKENAE